MSQRKKIVVICPGRGSYNREELGYLKKYAQKYQAFLSSVDAYRTQQGQPKVQDLDSASSFQSALHTPGENASALIYACSMVDFFELDSERYEVVAVLGNSMGWYLTLAASGALQGDAGISVVNTMGSMMKDGIIGGQIVYPVCNDDWTCNKEEEASVMQKMETVRATPGAELFLSIRLGGMLVLAGNEAGLKAIAEALPKKDSRYPMRLLHHAAFHTPLLESVSERGLSALPSDLFQSPTMPIIDGRGAIWYPESTDPEALRGYTLRTQVLEPYDFTKSLVVGLKEFAPDHLVLLGPGGTLGGSIGQVLVQERWLGLRSKSEFQARQCENPFLLCMGRDNERKSLVKP